jgi:hypothetical protein
MEPFLDGLDRDLQQLFQVVLGIDPEPDFENQFDVILEGAGAARSVLVHVTPLTVGPAHSTTRRTRPTRLRRYFQATGGILHPMACAFMP